MRVCNKVSDKMLAFDKRTRRVEKREVGEDGLEEGN